MEQYGTILLFTIPFFLILIVLEKIYGFYKGINHAPIIDSVASISSGITNSLKDVLGLSIVILSYSWMVSNLALFHQKTTVLTYAIAFIIINFYGYWAHRWAHQINLFWNKHAIHHSSEEFNLSCALRQPISNFLNLFSFLLLPAALLGVPKEIITIILPIHLFLQFWYHTRYINKLGFLEYILVTPSHHRVHHAINPEYIDKNHSQIFIFWDKLFGTFQAELDNVPPVYGITRPAQTWNPIKINFQHLWLLITDAYRADNWRDKFTIWFQPTGWRPKGFEEKYPINKIENVYAFEKYGTSNANILIYWAMTQMFATLIIVSYLFGNIAKIGKPAIFSYGAFVFISIYSYSKLMDKNKQSVAWEIARCLLGLGIIKYYGDWFGLNTIIPFGNLVMITYLLLSLIMNGYLIRINFGTKKQRNTTNH